MKKFWVFSFFAISLFLNACQKDAQVLTDDELAQQIVLSDSKQVVPPTDLPPTVVAYLDENHFESYVETASLVNDKGYEVVMGDESRVFCDRQGRVLRPVRRGFSQGPCGRGEAVRVAGLPAAVTDYVAANYPDAQIKRAKQLLDGPYFVKIDDPNLILIFNNDGGFVEATVLFYHCRPLGTPVDIATLSSTITDYVAANFPNSTIKVAFEKVNGMVIVGLTSPSGRIILGFDAAGNLVFSRP